MFVSIFVASDIIKHRVGRQSVISNRGSILSAVGVLLPIEAGILSAVRVLHPIAEAFCRPSEYFIRLRKHPIGRESTPSDRSKHRVGRESISAVAAGTLSAIRVHHPGTPLSDGAVTPADILRIKGPTAVQDYIVNEVQDVYRLQGVKINDKHFEVIVRQMMRKVNIIDPGDTNFLEQQIVDKRDFMDENDRIWGYKSNEKGEIKVRFKFKKFLNSTNYMIFNISSLISIDLSSFISTEVNNMSSMFWGCYSLESINLSSLNTAKVENMDGMFMDCYSLKLIDLSSFNTTNVKDISRMFSSCSSLTSINLSSFNTTNVEDMAFMFADCSSLKNLDLSSFNTINVKNMLCLFSLCSSLESLDISSFNTTNVKYLSGMFLGCSSLKEKNVKINKSQIQVLNELNKH